MSEDPNQTTTFEAKLPGGSMLSLATKSPMVLINILIVAGLVYIGMQVMILTNKVEVLTYSIERSNKLTRERNCIDVLREQGTSIAACKTMSEIQ